MNQGEQDGPIIAGMIAGALVGAVAAAIILRRRHPAGPGSDERPLALPPPDDATLAKARDAAGEITARLRGAFPRP